MRRRIQRLISWCIRSAVALVALQGAGPSPAQEAGPAPARPLVLREQQDPAKPQPPAVELAVEALQNAQPTLADLVEANRQNYRAFLISELHFCRSACDLTQEQSQQIALRAGPLVEAAAESAAKLQLKPARRGGIRLASDPAPANPVKLIRDILSKIVKQLATPAQQSRYQVELTKRAASRKQFAIHNLVARLDRTLILTRGQRQRLLQSLESHWDDEWGALESMMGDDDAPFPAIPDSLIDPCLTSTQKRVWREFDKQAIDATEAYLNAVSEVMEDLPSDFTPWLEAAARETLKLPALEPGAEKKKDAPNQKSR